MGLIPCELGEQIQDLIPDDGIQPGGGFVQHQQLCLMAQRRGDGELHLHAAGVVLEGGLFRQGKAFAVSGKGLRLPAAVGGGHDFSHLRGGETFGEAPLVQHHADVLFDTQKIRRGYICPQCDGSAAVRPQRAHENADEGGFARAVFSHQTADGAGGDGQGYVPEGKFSEGFFNMLQFDGVCHCDSSHARRSRTVSSSSVTPQLLPSSAAAARWLSSW